MSQVARSSPWRLWQVDAGAIALLMLLAAGVYWIEASPSLGRRDAALGRMRDLEGRQAKKRDIEKSMAAVNRRVEAATKSIADTGFTLDSVTKVNERLARIAELAASTGLQVEAIEPSKSIASGHLASITIRVTAKGAHAGVSKFIHGIRDRMPDCVIASLELTAAPAAQDPVANASIQIIWHATPDNPIAGK